MMNESTTYPEPTSEINVSCALGLVMFVKGYADREAGIDWKKNGRSWSCPYCGSMSTEELISCLDDMNGIQFNMNDHYDKVYLTKYPHAGDCPQPPSLCACEVKSGGGPIKFMMIHLFDGGRSRSSRLFLLERIMNASGIRDTA